MPTCGLDKSENQYFVSKGEKLKANDSGIMLKARAARLLL